MFALNITERRRRTGCRPCAPPDDGLLIVGLGDHVDAGPVAVQCGQTWEVLGLEARVEVPITVAYVAASVPHWPRPADGPWTEVLLEPDGNRDALLVLRTDPEQRLVLTPLPRLAHVDDPETPSEPPGDGAWQTHPGAWAAVLAGQVVETADTPAALLARLAESSALYDSIVAIKDGAWDSAPTGL